MSGLVDHTRTSGSGSGANQPGAQRSTSAYGDARQRRQAARTRVLSDLMRERADLQGVHGPADLAVEGVRWCV
jgi:hypothetical protein